MSRKAVFLDRDGTLIEDKGYMSCSSEVNLLEGTIDALLILKKLGFEFIIISNQSGIGRGLITKTQVEEINKYLIELLAFEGIFITAIYYCPHTPEDNCICRKPKPEMVLSALNKYDISEEESFLVGDKITDAEAAINAGVKPILISSDSKLKDNSPSIMVWDSLLAWAQSIN